MIIYEDCFLIIQINLLSFMVRSFILVTSQSVKEMKLSLSGITSLQMVLPQQCIMVHSLYEQDMIMIQNKEKEEALNSWIQDKSHVIVATIAFGMGINKVSESVWYVIDQNNVRLIIHWNLPQSLYNYYQVVCQLSV